jgi:hypothetical protein
MRSKQNNLHFVLLELFIKRIHTVSTTTSQILFNTSLASNVIYKCLARAYTFPYLSCRSLCSRVFIVLSVKKWALFIQFRYAFEYRIDYDDDANLSRSLLINLIVVCCDVSLR